MTPMPEEHDEWSELAVGHALSSLDDADEAMYLEHAASCETCRELEREFSDTLADLALVAPAVAPPPSLKASIMAAIAEDEPRRAVVIPIDRYSDSVGSRARRMIPLWVAGVAAAVVAIALVAVWVVAPGHKQASIAARCAAVNCPVVTLTGGGQSVAAVMVLDNTAYIDPHGLPATPKGDVYVLWALSAGKSVGVAALHTVPSSGPVRAGSFTTPIGNVSGFAVTEEQGDVVPAAPSEHLLAQGSRV